MLLLAWQCFSSNSSSSLPFVCWEVIADTWLDIFQLIQLSKHIDELAKSEKIGFWHQVIAFFFVAQAFHFPTENVYGPSLNKHTHTHTQFITCTHVKKKMYSYRHAHTSNYANYMPILWYLPKKSVSYITKHIPPLPPSKVLLSLLYGHIFLYAIILQDILPVSVLLLQVPSHPICMYCCWKHVQLV